MTIIACKDGVMAADSWLWRNDINYPIPQGHEKIVRLPDGGLVGCAGAARECYKVKRWIANGMDFSATPEMSDSADDLIDWMWLKTDGSLWRFNHKFEPCPVSQPYTLGILHAAYMADGAMAAGASAVEAVEIVIAKCAYVGGPIQVEHLAAAA